MCRVLRTQCAVQLETLLMARMEPKSEYTAMVKTSNECQHVDCMSVHGKKSFARKCCSKPSFSLLLLNTLLAEPQFNALVVVWSGERSTRGTTRITGCDTAQTERILDKTCDRSTSLDSRLYQAMRMKTTQHTIHELTPFHLVYCCRRVSDVQSPSLLSPHFVHGSGLTVASQRSAAVRINPSMTHRDVQSVKRNECQWGRRRRRCSNVHCSPTVQERLCFCLTRCVSNTCALEVEAALERHVNEVKATSEQPWIQLRRSSSPRSRQNASTRVWRRDA